MSYTPPPASTITLEFVEVPASPSYTPPSTNTVTMDFAVGGSSSGGVGGNSDMVRKVNFLLF